MSEAIEEYVERLWTAATGGDEYAAAEAALAALDDGVPMETLLLDVVAAVQSRVGREWAADRLSVAQEHTATAINERVVAALAHHPSQRARPAPSRGQVAVACIDGEWHAFPARLLAEVLRVRGWRVDYLGAQVPAPYLVAHLHRNNPDVVALSSSLAIRLPAAHSTITACQAAGLPVLAGGAAFGPDGRYARLLGADAWAPDARSAADLLAAGPLPHRSARDEANLGGHEYAQVTRAAPNLVRAVLDRLQARPEQRLGPTAENVAHIVDYLRAALYVHDPELFSSFVSWMADVSTARGFPAGVLLSALEALADGLGGLPRALAMVARARSELNPPETGSAA